VTLYRVQSTIPLMHLPSTSGATIDALRGAIDVLRGASDV
jgi:hypothetical protein